MSTEDRLRAALEDRAVSARTSPDALDVVFGRVDRHRRNVRLAVAGVTALSVVAGVGVATNALRPARSTLRPTGDGPPTGQVSVPATTPPGSVAPTVSPRVSPPSLPPDRAVVALRDGRLVEISTTTGAAVAELGRVQGTLAEDGLAWHRDRGRIYYATSDCRVTELTVSTGATRRFSAGIHPAVSPDGTRVATIGCEGRRRVFVTDIDSGRVTAYAPLPRDPEDWAQEYSKPTDLAWYDDDRLLVARTYEGAERILLLDTRTDDSLGDARHLKDTYADGVAARGRTVLGVIVCCAPEEFEKPDPIVRVDVPTGRQVKIGQAQDFTGSVSFDRVGRLLISGTAGVWRFDGAGAPRLIRRGAVAVAG